MNTVLDRLEPAANGGQVLHTHTFDPDRRTIQTLFDASATGTASWTSTFSLAAPPLRSSDMRAVSDSIAVVEIEPKHYRMENQDSARSPSRSEYALVAWRTSGLMFSRM